MTKKRVHKSFLDDDEGLSYDEVFENQVVTTITGNRNKSYSEDTGFNNFDSNTGELKSWKTDGMW